MHESIRAYNDSRSEQDKAICDLLAGEIDRGLSDENAERDLE